MLSRECHDQSSQPSAIGSEADCESKGRWFKLRSGQNLSLRFGHEKQSTTILTLSLIQEGQLSVTGERMGSTGKLPRRLAHEQFG